MKDNTTMVDSRVHANKRMVLDDLTQENELLKCIPIAVYLCDMDGVIVNYNDAAVALWGRAPQPGELDRYCGAYTLRTTEGELIPKDQSPMAASILDGTPVENIVVIFERPDASQVFVRASIFPVFNSRGKRIGIINYLYNITRQELFERKLKTKEVELTDYVENANVSMHWVDEHGIIKWANKSELELLGYTEQEYIGHHITKFHVHREKIDDILNRLSCNEQLEKYESQLRCKDGSIKTVQINTSVYRENGKFIHTRCFTVDITEEKKLWDALSSSQSRYKRLLSSLPAAIYTCNKEGQITFYNDLAVKLWGYTPDISNEQVRFCACYKVFVDGIYIAPHETPMAVALKTGQSFRNVQAQVEQPNGQLFYAAVNIDPLYDEHGNISGAINIIQDISAIKEAEMEIKRTAMALQESEGRYRELVTNLESKVNEKTKDLLKKTEALEASEERMKQYLNQLEFQNGELEQFVYAASHDLKEPLRKMNIYNGYIAGNPSNKLDDKSREYLNRSINAVARMKKLIEDLLVYSRSTSAGDRYEEVDLNTLIEEIASNYNDTLEQIKGQINADKLPVIRAIPFQIRQLLNNLVDNAIKYRHSDRLLIIKVQSDEVDKRKVMHIDDKPYEKYLRLTITDNGIGFDSKYTNKIFEIFQRLTNNGEATGTGIGLAICKKIVLNHNGLIDAEGELDTGARFTVYLPVT